MPPTQNHATQCPPPKLKVPEPPLNAKSANRPLAGILYRRVPMNLFKTSNKSAQRNLGTGPRLGAAAHVRRKVPIGYNGVYGAPQIRPQK